MSKRRGAVDVCFDQVFKLSRLDVHRNSPTGIEDKEAEKVRVLIGVIGEKRQAKTLIVRFALSHVEKVPLEERHEVIYPERKDLAS